MHYGIFWVVHGVFVWTFDLFTGGSLGGVPLLPVLLATGVTLLTHGGSLLTNFVGREEYRHISPGGQMAEPYKRVIVLHLTILFGAFLVAGAGTPVAALVVMVVVKSVLDIAAHVREHTRARKRLERAEQEQAEGGPNEERVSHEADSDLAF
ncbi:DUF6498-containing protein [Haloferax sp. DFSO60]|uniref:DUF6498-containing protein n=1 Tax=Haloferax sp. DFSO60 TaxID=3388652 RepID=UPI00397AF6E5